MSLCILASGGIVRIAAAAFTLSWSHSVEHVRWEEDWQLTSRGLVIEEARVQGSGAGMEPPPDARFVDGWWRYRPDMQPLKEVALAASGATGDGWLFCANGTCREIGADSSAPIIIRRCESGG